MGTLTANQPHLPEYCEHKLPTSCRLTSIPNCCACADERSHAASYRTYIDGVGFVLRGTRWQSYCWFCKEFWENRVYFSGLRPGQTRVPEIPDQSEFLECWYQFYRGYRTVKRPDGSEEKIAVLGEDFRDVSPGYLPRTLEELRNGRERSDAMMQMARHPQALPAHEGSQAAGTTLDETLDQLFQAAVSEEVEAEEDVEEEEVTTSTAQRPAEAVADTAGGYSRGARSHVYQARRVAALRRELQRMRHGIERVLQSLRNLGEELPDGLGDAVRQIPALSTEQAANAAPVDANDAPVSATQVSATDRALANLQARVDEASDVFSDARLARERAEIELDAAQAEFNTARERLARVQREQNHALNYIRTFGTREEMEEQGEGYVSLVGNMFARAYERFGAAEEVRREQQNLREVLEAESRSGGEEQARILAELESGEADVWSVPTTASAQRTIAFPADDTNGSERNESNAEDEMTRIAAQQMARAGGLQIRSTSPRRRYATVRPDLGEPDLLITIREDVVEASPRTMPTHTSPSDGQTSSRSLRQSLRQGVQNSTGLGASTLGLDSQDRPEPRTEDELRLLMDCKICYTQIAEVACLPCGHLVMCKWCSELHSPTLAHDRTRPATQTSCPVCRKRVRNKVRVYRA